MLPYLQEVGNPSKKYTVSFKGLNYGEGTQDGEFSDTLNLSTDLYPCITQRAARINAGKYKNPLALHSKGNLLVIDERFDEEGKSTGFADVYYGDDKVGEVTAGKKQTATVGNYIVIYPDKKYYKVPTEDDKDGEFGGIEAEVTAEGVEFTTSSIKLKTEFKTSWLEFTASTIKIGSTYKATGLKFGTSYISKTGADFHFKAGDTVTISGSSKDANNKEVVIKEATSEKLTFDDSTFTSVSTESNEVTITKKVTAKFPFKAGDTVTISGCTADNNKEVVITEATEDTLTFEEGTFTEATEYGEITFTRKGGWKYDTEKFPLRKGDAVTITGCETNGNNKEAEILIRGLTDDEITFDSNAFTAATENGVITIKRTAPDLDFICEDNGRLWGTHGNTIYSSKYSDPLNFKVFDGLSSDSYYIDVSSNGEFTGCMPFGTHICFFKENTLHKLYGSKPSNFSLTDAIVYGVQAGSEKSMQIVNEQLIYKGVGGVYSYTGGVPELLSPKFGNNRYSEAVACCDGERYFISMKQGDNWNLFVYDVLKNIWLREDDTHAVDMTLYNGKVYYLDSKGELYYIDRTADRSDIEWEATFCTIHETMNERKGYSKFHMRMDLEAGAWLAVDIKTDNDLKWKQVYTTHSEKSKTATIPIVPTRCDSIDIRLRGKGKCTIKAFVREFTVGSEV